MSVVVFLAVKIRSKSNFSLVASENPFLLYCSCFMWQLRCQESYPGTTIPPATQAMLVIAQKTPILLDATCNMLQEDKFVA